MARQQTYTGHHLARHKVFAEGEWLLRSHDTAPLAAHVITLRGCYTHHGIYVGGGRVVHYPGLVRFGWSGPVEEISLTEFASGRPVWVRPCISPPFEPKDVVARARSRLGENRYRLLSNNCEHFCEWCVRGEHRSQQVEAWCAWPRQLLRAAVERMLGAVRLPTITQPQSE